MMLPHLLTIDGPVEIRRFEDRSEAGFSLIRTDTTPPVEVAIVNDGSDRGIGEAAEYAKLFRLSPVMLALLREALEAWSRQFDAPTDATDAELYISGADLLEWFSGWRERVRGEMVDTVMVE